MFDNTSGVLIENATRITARANHASANTAGVVVAALPDRPVPVTRDVVVDANLVRDNNRPNPNPPQSFEGQIPVGTGILNVAGDGVVLTRNVALGNGTFGIGIIASPLGGLDPRVEPNPDDNRVTRNVLRNNGTRPDLARTGGRPGADIVYDGSGVGNCFGRNVFGTEFPPGVTALFACP